MTDKPPRPKLMLIHESVLQSWARDASTFALFAGLIGLGWLLNSEPMQWVGAIVAFICLMGRFCVRRKEYTFTIAEARSELDRIEKAS